MIVLNSAKDIVKAYLLQVCLQKYRKEAEFIIKELFSDSITSGDSYKFDFSLNLNYPQLENWRFTYNDKGEKNFKLKILNIFKFLNCYNIRKINNILNVINEPATLGIDWFNKDRKPKLKLEFEFESKNKDTNMYNKVFPILGIDIEKASKILSKLQNITAISFAFKGKSLLGWKVYIRCKPKQFKGMVNIDKNILQKAKCFLKKDSDSFSLVGYRFNKESLIESIKFYKIYESRGFMGKIDIEKRYKDVGILLNNLEKENLKNNLAILFASCSRHDTIIFPTVISKDYEYKTKYFNRTTVYLSVCPNKR